MYAKNFSTGNEMGLLIIGTISLSNTTWLRIKEVFKSSLS